MKAVNEQAVIDAKWENALGDLRKMSPQHYEFYEALNNAKLVNRCSLATEWLAVQFAKMQLFVALGFDVTELSLAWIDRAINTVLDRDLTRINKNGNVVANAVDTKTMRRFMQWRIFTHRAEGAEKVYAVVADAIQDTTPAKGGGGGGRSKVIDVEITNEFLGMLSLDLDNLDDGPIDEDAAWSEA